MEGEMKADASSRRSPAKAGHYGGVGSRRFLYPACLLLGGYSLLAQVLLVREFLVVFFGNELALGVILSSWLVGIAIGSQLAPRIIRSDAPDAAKTSAAKSGRKAEAGVVVLALLMPFLLRAALYATRSARLIFATPAGQLMPFGDLWLAALCMVTPVSIASGATFPLLCAALARKAREAGWEIGKVYVLEAVGTVIAGSLFTYVLAGRASTFQIDLAAGILVALNATALAFAFGFRRLRLVSINVVALTVLGILFSGPFESETVRLRWGSFAPGVRLIESTDSKYQNLTIGMRENTYALYSNGQYVTSFPDDYTYQFTAHTVMVQHPSPKRVLLIGGGVEGLLKEILKHRVEKLDVALIDPAWLELIEPYLPAADLAALDDPRVHVFHVDGRLLVKDFSSPLLSPPVKYDMVFCYVPDPSTGMLNRLYTREFFSDVKAILDEGGVFITGISSAVNYIGQEVGLYTGSLYETLKRSFRYVVVAPGGTNTFFCSNHPGAVTHDPTVMEERYASRGVEPAEFRYLYEVEIMPPLRTQNLRERLDAETNRAVNSDFRPVTYYFNLILWGRFSGSRIAAALVKIKDVKLQYLLAGILVLLAARLFYRAASRREQALHRRTDTLLAIGTTGMAAMGLEVVLLLAFQSIYGYVYEKIGIIVAVFMAGLAVGGLIGARIARGGVPHVPDSQPPGARQGDAANWAFTLTITEMMVAAFAALTPLALWWLAGLGARPHIESAFMGLVAIGGLLTGLEFPIAGKAYLATGAGAGISAGMVDSADHMGAAAGAAVAGVLLVPLLGIPAACAVFAAANAATAVLQMFHVEHLRFSRSARFD